MKKILGLLAVLLSAGMLMGCIGVKELTEEEEARISEYAATLLLKYDANYKNLLWEEEETEEDEKTVTGPAIAEENKEEETATGSAVTGEESKENPAVDKKSLAEAFGLSDMDIQYSGCEFTKNFPKEGERSYAVRAEEGKKLLVLKFQVKNNATSAASVDISSGNPSFRMHFNGEDVIIKMTILVEDLSTMIEDVPAGAVVEKVLIGEVSEDFPEQADTLSIVTKFQGNTSETTLIP